MRDDHDQSFIVLAHNLGFKDIARAFYLEQKFDGALHHTSE